MKLEMNEGFEGCIQYLKFNQKVFNISFPSEDIVNGENLGKNLFLNNTSFLQN